MRKVRAKKKAGGEYIDGYFCYAPFIKSVDDLTEEEQEQGVHLKLTGTYSTGTSLGTITSEDGEYLDGYLMVVREAVQIIDPEAVLEVVTPPNKATATASGSLPVFVEIVPGSARESTGFTDKNGQEIFVGDKIRYAASLQTFEEYEVVFSKGKFTTSPAWPWGCNFSPFESSRCQLVAE